MKEVKENYRSYSGMLRMKKIVRTLVCVLLCLVSVFPFYVMVINATRDSASIQQGLAFIPSKYFIINFHNLMKKAQALGTTIWASMRNSATITFPATVLCVYFSALTAYGVFAYNYKMRNFAWSFILGIMMIPTQVSIIGFYKFMIMLKLTNSYWPLILPAIASPTTVFFMRQYMKTALPLEIVEAARIDGSGEFKTFNNIVLPMLKPAVATQAIFAFLANWNNLFMPSMIISNQKLNTLPMFVQQLRSEQFRADYGVIYVGLVITIIPIVIVYLALSKYIIAGVALGGVKE